jgi:ribulose-phosphate 3-epimerase
MSHEILIAPSVLSADLARLAEQIAIVEEGGADWIHVDVMDGHFVPNLTFGAGVIDAVKRSTSLPVDVHLMVERPEFYIAPFADAGADVFTFHPETTAHVQRQLDQVRACGMRAGLALNPGTPLDHAEEVVGELDLLLIMTVNPGFAAQHYIATSTNKIQRARQLLDAHGSGARLEVDGGITRDTIGGACQAGADTFVAGSAVFGADDPAGEVAELRKHCYPVA